MVLTNELLSIGFALITNFTAKVPIPDNAVLTDVADVMSYRIGMPGSPIHLVMATKEAGYWINDGVVYLFGCRDCSFFQLQNPLLISNYTGRAVLEDKAALDLACTTLLRLAKTGQPPINAKARVEQPKPYRGQPIPFYRITWPKTNLNGYVSDTAEVQIDSRTGRIVLLHVWDDAFRDFAFAREISNRVFFAEPLSPQSRVPSRRPTLPRPSTNEVSRATANCLMFCDRLGLEPGNQTNLDSVDWNRVWLYTNKHISAIAPIIQVWFTNGSGFEALDGIVFRYFAKDSCFTGFWDRRSPEEWKPFQGRITRKWEDLAKRLEPLLVRNLGIPTEAMARLLPSPQVQPPVFERQGIKRIPVEWRDWPKNADRTVWINETKRAFAAEFDLETGELKWFSIDDPKLIEAICRAQSEGAGRRQREASVRTNPVKRLGAEPPASK